MHSALQDIFPDFPELPNTWNHFPGFLNRKRLTFGGGGWLTDGRTFHLVFRQYSLLVMM
jgi:hypothetical protein